MAWSGGLLLVVVVIVGGGILFFQKQSGVPTPAASSSSTAPSEQSAQPAATASPIIKDNKGVTEISLSRAPEVASQPTLGQLKEFRRRSEELQQKADQIKKEKREQEITALIDKEAVKVEPLYTFEAQKRGLIGRENLPEDDAMLYVFQMDDAGRLFGTKGMKFPLDFIWMNSDTTVVQIHKNVPPDFDGDLKSLWPARYVLEVNAGYVDRHGINVGDTIDLSKIPH